MKFAAFVVLTVLTALTSALAQSQSQQDAIKKAVLAAPENMREGAMVIRWKPDFTYEVLRKGTNGLVCYDRSGQPEHQPFMIECTSVGNLKRAAQNIKFESVGDKVKTQALLDAAEKNGTREKPEYGSVWYHFFGTDQAHAHPHMTIAMPGATTQSTGLPDTRRAVGVWLMDAGTSTAHLMTPGE